MPGSFYTGSMVQTGEVSSHKCVRTSGSKISPTEFHQKQESKSYTLSDREYNSIEVFDKDGRCGVFGNDQIKQKDMGLSSITWDHNYYRIPPKQTEHKCRQGIQGEGRFFRVETRPKGVSRASSINGEPSSRFACISTKPSITPVHRWRPDPFSQGTDAVNQDWSQDYLYAFPPFCLISRILQKARQERKPNMLLITPTWNTQPWYPSLLQVSIETPVILSRKNSLLKDPLGKEHPLITNKTLRLTAWKI